jgi:hypothetical protein
VSGFRSLEGWSVMLGLMPRTRTREIDQRSGLRRPPSPSLLRVHRAEFGHRAKPRKGLTLRPQQSSSSEHTPPNIRGSAWELSALSNFGNL